MIDGMYRRLSITTFPTWTILSRSFWALMGAVHASALVSALKACIGSGTELKGLGACITLSIAMLFFLLKFGGVSFLRFRTGKRACVAICLTVALIHIDCIQPSLEGTLASDCTAILATTTLACGLTRVPQTVRAALARSAGVSKPSASAKRSNEVVWLDGFRPRCWVLAARLFLLRAPPV